MGEVKHFIDVLTEAEVLKLHGEALTVLNDVGMKVPHPEALRRCARAGFAVDEGAQVVRFPSPLVEELLRVNRPKEQPEGPVKQLIGGVSTQIHIVDYPGHVRRKGLLSDVRKGAMVTDRLTHYGASSAVVIPSDYPADRTDLVSYRELSLYSRRPGGTYILSPDTARGIIEMDRVMNRRTGYLLESVSPLGFMTSSLEMAILFADAGMPIGTAPMVIAGASGPMSIWGTAVLEVAETLGTNLVIWALGGTFSGFLSCPCHTMDMSTMLCSFGSPNQALFGLIAGQMGRFYGFGSNANAGLTDALRPSFQYGFETAFTGLAALWGGTSSIGAQGIVGADQGISLELLVLANDWMAAYDHVMRGVEYDPEALDLIKTVGIGGSFMTEEHTIDHLMDVIWSAPSGALNRDFWNEESSDVDETDYARAHRYVMSSIEGWEKLDPVVSPDTADQIERIYRDTMSWLDRKV